MDAGADVIDIGLSGTEEMYFASFFLGVDGGIEVTASHNPANCNGFKFIGPNARPIGLAKSFPPSGNWPRPPLSKKLRAAENCQRRPYWRPISTTCSASLTQSDFGH